MKLPPHKEFTPHEFAVMLGKLGGQSKSKAKAEAARRNGKLGGRPKGSQNKPKR